MLFNAIKGGSMRRSACDSVGVLAAVLAVLTQAHAQYPARPLRIIVPTSTGGASDTVARLMSQPLSERLGQQVVVDNRAGASTMIGTEAAAKSAPDGYTLLIAPPAFAINPSLYKKMPYDALRDFVPIIGLVKQPNILVVHPSIPSKSVKELIALSKSRPDEIAFASSGAGSSPHLSIELFLMMTGTRMLHVPYKGASGIVDLIAGRVSVMMPGIVSGVPHVRGGRLRALGVTDSTRAATMPDVPTIADAGVPGFEVVQWNGLIVPAGTSKEIVARLHKDIATVLLTQEIRERLAREGAEVIASSPAEFAIHIRAEIAKWAKVVKAAAIKPE
jgi:tripartite-type tricarboxylate transporter receptor subunit TctC